MADPKMMKAAMQRVLESMGHAAKASRMAKFQKRPMPPGPVGVSPTPSPEGMGGNGDVGDQLQAPSPGADMAHEMDEGDMNALLAGR